MMSEEKMAIEVAWTPKLLKIMQDAAGCGPWGCSLRYLGESHHEPCHVFRHEAYTDEQVCGGEIRIGNYQFARQSVKAVSSKIIEELKRHHEARRIVGEKPGKP